MFFKKLALFASFVTAFFMPVLAHAQNELALQPMSDVAGLGTRSLSSSMMGMFTGIGGILLVLSILLLPLIFIVIAMHRIAKKTGVPHGWAVIIPFVAPFIIAKSAGKSYWFGLLQFLPLLGAVSDVLSILSVLAVAIIFIYFWMLICERLGHSKWLGLLMVIPLVNLGFVIYLGFSNQETNPVFGA